MVTLRQRTPVATRAPEPVVEDLTTIVIDDDSSSDSAVKDLRRRWELASVLNFFNVFRPLVSDKIKFTAEEIELGLIESNATNAQLHVALLKGIPPATNKSLDEADAWITVLCKKLAPWWPRIAKDEIPITASKGEEISEYKELDPIDRLKFLKALCELRVQQDDVRTYIQEKANEGALDSSIRKRKLGGDGKKISYWYDGNDIQGYRLYREVNENLKSAQGKKNASSDISSFCWETEATNLDEFQKVARELSSSKPSSLAATGQMIETDAIPVVEKYHKKLERVMKKKKKQEMALSVIFSRPMRTTRSCRTRVPATYTFDNYDRMISKAVEETEETNGDDEEGRGQQSGSMGSNNSSEGGKMKPTEDEAPESGNDDVKENGKIEEDAEPKDEIPESDNDGEKENRKSKEDAKPKDEVPETDNDDVKESGNGELSARKRLRRESMYGDELRALLV